jgi:hypothetical protein
MLLRAEAASGLQRIAFARVNESSSAKSRASSTVSWDAPRKTNVQLGLA